MIGYMDHISGICSNHLDRMPREREREIQLLKDRCLSWYTKNFSDQINELSSS
uniref:Uncharacterized protein n=1 Tax=Octopus bimaculoides TaxID=37653 RepID=A0A0L8GPC5_OCTBM